MGGTDLWIGGNKTVAHRKTGAMGSELSVARGWLWGDCLKIGVKWLWPAPKVRKALFKKKPTAAAPDYPFSRHLLWKSITGSKYATIH